MFVSDIKSARGYSGTKVTVTTDGSDVTWAFIGQGLSKACLAYTTGQSPSESDAFMIIPNGAVVEFYTFEKILNIQWALCSYTKDGKEYFCYMLPYRLQLNSISDNLPKTGVNMQSSNTPFSDTFSVSDRKESVINGEVWVANSDTWIMNPMQALLNSCEKSSGSSISDNMRNCYETTIGKGSLLALLVDSNNNPIVERLGPSRKKYYVALYNNTCRYVYSGSFDRYTSSTTTLALQSKYQGSSGGDVYVFTENIKVSEESGLMTSQQLKNYAGSNVKNIEANNYTGKISAYNTAPVVGFEIVNGTKFLITWSSQYSAYYMPYTSVDGVVKVETSTKALMTNNTTSTSAVKSYSSSSTTTTKNNTKVKYVSDMPRAKSTTYSQKETTTYKKGSTYREKSYKVTLESGKYPSDSQNRKTGAAYLEGEPDTRLPSDWGSDDDLLSYSLGRYNPMYIDPANGGHLDKRQITKINRFKFITDMSGLSTKSFIFMTKPDLNIYKLGDNNVVIPGTMNPDLKRIGVFKYIGRNKDVGYDILDSLEYWGTDSGHTPWLSIVTNQAEGYSPIDREISYTEVGETMHGNKVLYGKHDFKHTVAGTLSIPFSERRDLSLYYTLKLWTEYIHNINLGLVAPHPVHIINSELDYAVSLFFIQTDETMENIIYWEKLTGVFPLKCPDSFFEWSKGAPGKNMEYSIEFAYSMRSVLDPSDLLEIDRLYMKGASNDAETQYQAFAPFNYDTYNNQYISKMAAYFSGLTPDTAEFNNFVNRLMSGADDISKYYYEPFSDGLGNTPYFLPNYIPALQSHGIPYVKGPFIVPHPNYNGGKFLLKWV